MLFGRMRQRVGHVIWQDQEALDQRGRQNGNDRERNSANQVSKTTADSNQCEERNDCGQRRRKHR